MTETPQHEEQANPPEPEHAAPAPEVHRPPAPPRPFDAPPEEEEATAPEDEDPAGEPEPEVIDHKEPEPGDPFEDIEALPALLEALLFVADHPLDEGYLARALEVSTPRVRRALDELAELLREQQRGIRLQLGPEGAQLVSAPEAAAQIERFLGLEANRRLSTAALETLAIIAYQQPITRGQVDRIRGVSSDGAIQTLRARGLIEPAGHATGPGRPMLFRTSQRFLEHFGLERSGQLPPLPDDVDLPAAEISEQLGLDEALVEQALAETTAPDVTGSGDAASEAQGTPDEPPAEAAPGTGASLDQEEPEDDVTAPEAGDTSDDGVVISHDLGALAAAANQAFASMPPPPAAAEAGDEPDSEPRDAAGESDDGEAR